MWESRVLRRAFERLELHEGKLSRAVLRGGGGGDVTSLPDTWVGNHPSLPGPIIPRHQLSPEDAFQATFLELARRVGSIRRRESAERAEGATRSPAPSKRGWLLSPHGRCPNRYESGSKSTCPVTLAIRFVKIA